MRLVQAAGTFAGAQDRLARQRHRDAIGVDGDVSLGGALEVADGAAQHLGHARVALDDGGRVGGVGRGDAGVQLAERAQHHVGLAERGQHLADVAQERRVRPDDQHALALQRAAVSVEQVGGAVQPGDGLAGARAAQHDEDARQAGADHPVLLSLDRGHHVGHPAGAGAAHRGDQRRLAGQAGLVSGRQLVQVEDLVVDPGDGPATGVDVTPAYQPGGAARGGGVERAGGGSAPVDQLQLVVVVAQADPADVEGQAGLVVGAAEAQAPLDPVQLRETGCLLGRGHVTLQAGLVGATGHALRVDVGQGALRAGARGVEQAVQRGHVCLLVGEGDGAPGVGAVGCRAGAYDGVFGAFGVRGAFGAFRPGSSLTNCHIS